VFPADIIFRVNFFGFGRGFFVVTRFARGIRDGISGLLLGAILLLRKCG
jgi:hypothetical protein